MAKVTEKFFYTTDTPHQWSSGPSVHTMWFDEDKKMHTLTSIDEAREAARRARKGKWGEEKYVKTTYGVTFEEEWDD